MTVIAPEKVRLVVANGLSFTCAMCLKYWRAHDRSGVAVSEFVSCDGIDCGGPIVGKSFPEYEGPLTADFMASHCFRCGDPATKIAVVNGGRHVGVCQRHVLTMDRLVEQKR